MYYFFFLFALCLFMQHDKSDKSEVNKLLLLTDGKLSYKIVTVVIVLIFMIKLQETQVTTIITKL